MQPMPVYDAWKDLTERIGKKPRVLFMTPQGKPFLKSWQKNMQRKKIDIPLRSLRGN